MKIGLERFFSPIWVKFRLSRPGQVQITCIVRLRSGRIFHFRFVIRRTVGGSSFPGVRILSLPEKAIKPRRIGPKPH